MRLPTLWRGWQGVWARVRSARRQAAGGAAAPPGHDRKAIPRFRAAGRIGRLGASGGDFGTICHVPIFYDFDRANAKLPEVRETLLRLRTQRDEIVAVRDRIVELNAPALARGTAALPDATVGEVAQETGRLRMKMQGLVDQMQAAVLDLDGWGIQLREIETGLVDFPALVAGRPVWLCWRLGEERVEWWHETTAGFEGRRRIEDLV
jgi:hypothetical protein